MEQGLEDPGALPFLSHRPPTSVLPARTRVLVQLIPWRRITGGRPAGVRWAPGEAWGKPVHKRRRHED